MSWLAMKGETRPVQLATKKRYARRRETSLCVDSAEKEDGTAVAGGVSNERETRDGAEDRRATERKMAAREGVLLAARGTSEAKIAW